MRDDKSEIKTAKRSTDVTGGKKAGLKTRDLAFIAVCAALITVCSWISVPFAVPFTLQTFAIFFTLYFLGGRRGIQSVIIYILLGAVGVPVFSGFKGGMGALFGTTGGYIMGFVFTCLVYWAFEMFVGKKLWIQIASMVIGLIVCYAFGTAWFMIAYAKNTGPISLMTALGWCVFPFIVPDLVKIALAVFLGKALQKYRLA